MARIDTEPKSRLAIVIGSESIRNEEVTDNGYGAYFGGDESLLKLVMVVIHTTVNTLKPLNWYIL